MNDHAAACGHCGPIAMPPYARKMLKIGSFIFTAIRIIPEFYRHCWERRGAAKLALLADQAGSIFVQNIGFHAKTAGLDFTGKNRLNRTAKNKT
jgi:hypothetical protein